MATNIVLKRSSTSGATPSTSDLELGELALNTYDGKMYMKKTVSGTSSIVELTGTKALSSSAFDYIEYKYVATSNQTSFSGNDSNGVSLTYTAGTIMVFLNGVLLDPTDYTATNGTAVVLDTGAASGDILFITRFAGVNPFDEFKYVATNAQTTFSGNDANSNSLLYTVGNIAVYLNGVLLDPTDYTATNTTSVVLDSAAATGDILIIHQFNQTGLTEVHADTTPQLAGDLDVNGNDIVSTSNGNIDIIPHGTGDVNLGTDTVKVGGSGEDVTLTTNGTGDITINTNSGTNSGSIVIADGANNDITITPNGTGDVIIDGLKYPQSDGSNGQVLKTNGSGQLSFGDDAAGTITAVANGADNRIATFSSSTALNGEANLTFDGSTLAASGAPFTISNTSNGNNIDIKTTSSNSLVHSVKIHSGGVFEAKQGAVFNEDSNDVDFRVESNGETHAIFVDAGNDEIGLFTSAPNGLLHIGDSAAEGDATNPALQIGGTTTYRLGLYTDSEAAYIENKNGDNGLKFRTKTVGDALTLDANGNAVIGGTLTVDAGIDVDNINIDGTTISQSGSSDLTIDVGGRIDLSADDNGEVRLYDGSSLYAQFKDDDDRFTIQGLIQDKNIMFVVNDGGTATTALQIAADNGGQLLAAPLGVANPTYSFAGDSNTGMTRPTGDTIQFICNGSQAMRVTESLVTIDGGKISMSDAAGNVSVGYEALNVIGANSGDSCTAVGYQALEKVTDGIHNTGMGYRTGFSITTGSYNVLMGNFAGDAITTATYNTAIGYGAGGAVDVGQGNTSIGGLAGDALTGSNGKWNTAVGFGALSTATAVFQNTAVGQGCLSNGNNHGNTGVGAKCLEDLTGGSGANGFGYFALNKVIGGDDNCGFGTSAGGSITSGDNNVCIGNSAGNDALTTITTGSNNVVIGNNSTAVFEVKVALTVGSDERDKTDIETLPDNAGLNFVNQMRPVTYVWDNRDNYWEYDVEPGNIKVLKEKHDRDHSKKSTDKQVGFIAQDIKKIEESIGWTEDHVVNTKNPESYKLMYEQLIPILVKSIQEADDKIDALTARVAALES